MTRPPREQIRLSLTSGQRSAILLLALLGSITWAATRPRQFWFGRRLHPSSARVAAASERIDPNTASVASLRRLPGIGIGRARDIVAWREDHGPGVFRTVGDLDAVHNIGPGTIRGIRPWLALPASNGGGR
jgi:competence ComEA-like helix-hairpin-helix protein